MDNNDCSKNIEFDSDVADEDLKSLCYHCFDVLINKISKKSEDIVFPSKFLNKSFPLFVTWTKGPEKDLRGCIGTFASDSLEKNLSKYALIAALNDSRFSPISLNELQDLQVGVSLLVNFERANHPLDWEIGKHGIEIDFKANNRDFRGTFLPEVAKEQEWDQIETLDYLIRKAGYKGKFETVANTLKVVRYQSVKIFLSYAEYIARKLGK